MTVMHACFNRVSLCVCFNRAFVCEGIRNCNRSFEWVEIR